MTAALLLLIACHGGNDPVPVQDSVPTDSGGTDTGDPAPPPVDADDDDYTADVDCDDGDASVFPGAPEICEDGVVNDCDMTEAQAQAFCAHRYSTAHAVADWTYAGSGYAARLGPVGDLNGDGLDDVVLGNPYAERSSGSGHRVTDVGATYVFLGPIEGSYVSRETHDEDFRTMGLQEWDTVGWDIAPMGDLDADGYDDFAVGAADDDMNWPSGTPSVYLVHGPARELDYTDDMVLLQGSSDEVDCLGSVLEPTPDADGDGMADLLVGGRCLGRVHWISSAGQQQVPWEDDIATFYIPLEETTAPYTFAEASRFGFSLASGDLDGDGVSDVMIGAPQPYAVANNCDESIDCYPFGFVSVFKGPANGAISRDDADIAIEGTADDSAIRHGEVAPDLELGVGLSAGDLNGDGYDDLVAGAPMRNEGDKDYQEGGVYVYFGPLSGSAYGIPDADLAILGDEDNDKCGGELDGSQDIDGDGQVDLLIGNGRVEVNGDSGSGEYGSRAQAAWLFLGPFSGGTTLAADADWIIRDPSSERLGTQARVAGDTDGDGMKELLIGNKDSDLFMFDLSVTVSY